MTWDRDAVLLGATAHANFLMQISRTAATKVSTIAVDPPKDINKRKTKVYESCETHTPSPPRILQAQDVHKLSRIGGVGGVKKNPLNRVKVLLVYSSVSMYSAGSPKKTWVS